MVPEDIGLGSDAVVLSEGFVVEQERGHTASGDFEDASVVVVGGFALVDEAGKDRFVLMGGVEADPIGRVGGILGIPGAAQPEAVARDAGGKFQPPGGEGR